MFARIFDNNDKQILVHLHHDKDYNPAIKISHELDNYNLCSITFSFEDTDEGIDKALYMLSNMTLQDAIDTINPEKIKSVQEKYK